MVALKYLLMILGAGLFGSAGALVAYDIFISAQLRRLLRRNTMDETGAEVGALAHRPFQRVRWRLALQLAAAGALAILITESIVVIPDGAAGVRVSQIWGAQPGTLYPGIHIVTPLVDSVAIFDTREQVYSTVASENAKQKGDLLTVQAREGLNMIADLRTRIPMILRQSQPRRRNANQQSGPKEAKKSARPGACATGFR